MTDPKIGSVSNDIKFDNPVDYIGNKSGTVSGTLSGVGVTSGSYSFTADIYGGVISKAAMNVNTARGNIGLECGIGYIYNGSFAIDDFKMDSATGAFISYNNANMTGNHTSADNNFDNINWNIRGQGGKIATGSGSPGTLRP